MTEPKIQLLVVDDDTTVLSIYDEILRGEGYEVATATSVAGARAEMDRLGGAVQVLVVDFGLPDADGSEFVRDAVRKFGPRPVLYVSGWSDEFWQLPDVGARWLMLRKPVAIKHLLAAVRWLAHGGDKPPELDEPA